jgi:hypothetical protein
MCAGCAMAAAAGATGVRTWLQTHHLGWLTPKRLRAVTVALMVAAFGVSTVGLSGSGTHGGGTRPAAPAAAQR